MLLLLLLLLLSFGPLVVREEHSTAVLVVAVVVGGRGLSAPSGLRCFLAIRVARSEQGSPWEILLKGEKEGVKGSRAVVGK